MSESNLRVDPASRRPRHEGLRLLIPDGAWALLMGAVSVGWFLARIALETGFFTPDDALPQLSALSVWGTVALFLGQSAALVWAGRHPLFVFWFSYALHLAAVALIVDRGLAASAAFLFAAFALAARTEPRQWLPCVGAAAAVDLGIYLFLASSLQLALELPTVLLIALDIAPAYLLPVLAGALYAAQQERLQARAEAARARADAALTSERYRMARELHDVATHHLSGIMLQSKAVHHLLETDPAAVSAAMESVATESDRAMRSLHDVIRVLRDGGQPPDPGPTLSSLPDLIHSVRSMHPELELDIDGDLTRLSPAASLACFRIIQESLTNARSHAPGARVKIRLSRVAGEVRVTVSNTRPPRQPDPSEPPAPGRRPRGGYGLIGMEERATILGGTLAAGPTDDGGWETQASLPADTRDVAR